MRICRHLHTEVQNKEQLHLQTRVFIPQIRLAAAFPLLSCNISRKHDQVFKNVEPTQPYTAGRAPLQKHCTAQHHYKVFIIIFTVYTYWLHFPTDAPRT